MTNLETAKTELLEELVKGDGVWVIAFKRFARNRMAVVCFIVIVVYAMIAIFTAVGLLGRDFMVNSPESYAPPSSEHWFGTDIFGRDVLARTLHGTRIALSIGLVTSLIAIPIGVTLGAMAGYFGGWIDEIVVWFYTTVESIPDILKIIALSFVLGRGITSVYIALGVTTWVSLCRLIRAEFMKHKNRDYVQAATALGASHNRRMFIHILPNVFHIILINFSLRFVTAINN
jgi:ABC-type dipeptide/oligopeptide/nickel transport system permease subunit